MIAKILLALAAAAAAGLVTRWISAGTIPTARIVRRNYRGITVPTGLGIAVIVGFLGGLGLVSLVHVFARSAEEPSIALLTSFPLLMLGLGFGLLGLFDDVAEQEQRGWRSHLPDLAHGRITPGTLKIVGGGLLAFSFGSSGESIGWAIVWTAIIALMANLFNALDVRPARAGKAFMLAGIPLAITNGHLAVPLASALGGVAVFLPIELRERAMLGDTGSNALGAIIGGALLVAGPPRWLQLAILGLLVVLTIVAEGPTISHGIDRIAPLKALDRLGRVPD